MNRSLTHPLFPQLPNLIKMSGQISKKRKFVADGVFRAELNDFFTRELSEEGYSGCDVRVTHARTEVRPCTYGLLGIQLKKRLP